MHFLQKVVQSRDNDSERTEEENEVAGPSAFQEADNNPTLQINRRITQKRPHTDVDNDPLAEVLNESIEKRGRYEEDEDRMFLLSLISSLKAVPFPQKMALKINIMNLINEAICER